MSLPSGSRLAKKVLLIGWDAADWKVITPLLDAGKMPSLESLIDRGVMGNLATLDPPLSPMLWTSIATGKTADQHGILNFLQPTSDGTRLRPVLGTSRKCKAVWNILNQEGLRSNVVGWWPSHPAEPLNGAMVSNFYQRAARPIYEPWPLPNGCVHPPELADRLAALRVHAHEMTANHLLPFVPSAREDDDPKYHRYLSLIAKTLAEASSVQAAATYLADHAPWDFMAVYFDAVDHFCHGFMSFHPPQRPSVPDDLYERYHGVVEAGYRFHDMMLGQLLRQVDDDTTVLLISDHGFHSDHLRPIELPDEPAAPALEHRDHGVIVMAGPGIKRDDRLYGATLLDIAPTVLTLFGLPVGRDQRGKVLADAFAEPVPPAFIDSWETVPGDAGRHPGNVQRDPWAEQEAMRQLVELGYVEPGQGQVHVDRIARESSFYLARVHLGNRRPDLALPLLEAAFEADPQAERFGLRLVESLRLLDRVEEARATLERVMEGRRARLTAQLAKCTAELDALAGQPATDDLHLQRERLALKRDRTTRLLEATPPGYHFHRGLLLAAEDRYDEALDALQAAQARVDRYPMLTQRIGEVYLQLQRWSEAEASFRQALATDPHHPAAHRGLALALLRQDHPEDAAQAALRAVGLQYYYPAAHAHLGEALLLLDEPERAAQALEVALHQSPGMKRIRLLLADVYRTTLGKPEQAAAHLRFAAERIR
ncbi:MAG: alkaline phosphatase family protein [Bacteroidota bacterium]